jgi:chromosome segregation ATPase
VLVSQQCTYILLLTTSEAITAATTAHYFYAHYFYAHVNAIAWFTYTIHSTCNNRWRKLESSDPERLDLLKQVQSLQQRLIAKADAIEQKDKLITQKEELYVELKNVMARQPGPETAEQLTVFQENLKQKCKQLKRMEDELQMYRQQVEVFKLDIDAANADMRAVNAEWLQHMEQQWQAAANAQYYQNMQQQQQQQQYYSSNSSGTVGDHGVMATASSSAAAANTASTSSFIKSITAPAT